MDKKIDISQSKCDDYLIQLWVRLVQVKFTEAGTDLRKEKKLINRKYMETI